MLELSEGEAVLAHLSDATTSIAPAAERAPLAAAFDSSRGCGVMAFYGSIFMRTDKEEASLAGFLQILAVMALIAAVLKFGALTYLLTQDLKRSECQTAYWRGVALQSPRDQCPSGCDCPRVALK